jgi:cyclopropane fatty-acyl-phospholipid synthase-like methyltransferase/methyltransferase-like protein
MSKPYEIVRYAGMPFAQTHPDRLATLARLFGMTPPDIRHARILEIGCCDGGNIIPMALSLPDSECVGIDLTSVDIEAARQAAADIGVTNLQFHAMDLTELPGPLGQFDYIVAHGLYAWVPPDVREKMLAVIKASLTPNGVAYVSYNALPGAHMRMMIRDMMRFHTSGVEAPDEILSRCRQLLQFVCFASGRDPDYQAFIQHETEQMFSRPSYGLFHDELEEHYHPVYFHEFAAHAARCGLQYLAEANYFDMTTDSVGGMDSPVFDEVAGDFLLREQYLDFARCRRFRQTLICHDDIPLKRDLQLDVFQDCYFASPAKKVAPSADEELEEGVEEFHGPKSSKVKTAHSVVLRIMHRLVDAWPAAIPFSGLSTSESERNSDLKVIHALYSSGLIEARTVPPTFAISASERPVASPLARWQAIRNVPITTLRHTTIVTSGDIERRLISLLDGTRTRVELYAELAPMLSTNKPEEELKAELETTLNTMGTLCILSA